MTQIADEREVHQSNFSLLQEQQNGDGAMPQWLEELRRAGMRRFEDAGFPTTREEEWRFTNVAPIAKTAWRLAEVPRDGKRVEAATQFSFGAEAAAELVFVNGHYSAQLSKLGRLPRAATVRSLSQALTSENGQIEGALGRYADIEKNPFVALNTGFIRDGAYLHFAPGTTVEGPIHLLFVSTGESQPIVSLPRVLVVAEDNVEAQIVESYVGTAGQYFTNAVTEIVLGADCRIDHCKLQQESLDAYHVASMKVNLGTAATFVSHAATIGGKLTRNDLECTMAGERAYATLNGLVLIRGGQHCDNHTLLDHAMPNCPSHELYKHVLEDKATGVFKGKILVRKDAQKTDSKQNSKSLLLSDDAMMESMPALEIYADDVKCTHGSTTGPVDEDMVFYLRTRGVGLQAARHLLTYAFAADVTRRMKVAAVRQRLEDHMAARHGLPQDLRITDLGEHDVGVL